MAIDSSLLQSLKWRCIGPPRGGRVVAVSGDPVDPAVFYFGACAGGVWKTFDGGQYWENISDTFFKTAAVGAITVSEADPNVIYVGMGESCIRGDVSHGDGVYKSTDAGKTWAHMGLTDTRHIAKIRVHPQNPELVYVAALGHAFGSNEERGVFRSKDGGKTWEKILYRSPDAGAIDLMLDPCNPRVLYAALWQVRRTFWNLSSGGPDSGFFKSIDGGDTWVEITDNPGLPKGLKGKMGVAVSAVQANRVWALVEAEEGGLYRSDDGGATWTLVSDDRNLRHRPWYYMHVFADPHDADTVYVLNLDCWKSIDGGRTFTEIATPHGDNHDLWIDPRTPRRMIEGNDGGACVSYNGGDSWSTIYNQMTAQFYHVATDNQFPYRVYGTQQDNSSISTPSRTYKGAILWGDSYPAGTGESGYIAVKPDDPHIVYVGAIGSSPGGGGALQRYDHRTEQIRLVTVWPEIYGGWGAKDLKYRFQWTFPILFSPHDPNLLYTTGNVAFRSTDEGASWEVFSPDLTRKDVTKMEPSGGPITKDTTGAEHYGTIFAFIESLHERGVFWAGSDDGLIHLSRDGGKTWVDVTPPDLPEWSLISMIEQSPHDPATVYIAALRYKLDDNRPFLYKTNDYGQTWTKIIDGIPMDDFTRVIRADPARRGLLYVGTETRVYVSFDDGVSWQALAGNLPVVPIYDLVIKDNDLVAATHGRSFWILDDLTPIHQITDQLVSAAFALFKPRDPYRFAKALGSGWYGSENCKNYNIALGIAATYYEQISPYGEKVRTFLDAGANPPDGVVIHYYLQVEPEDEVIVIFKTEDGQEIKRFTRKPADSERTAKDHGPWLPIAAGMNRFTWNLRYPDAVKALDDPTTERGLVGPLAPPGRYQVELKVGAQICTQTFEILKDARVLATQADFDAQFDLLIKIRDKLTATHIGINQLRSIRSQAQDWEYKTAGYPDLCQKISAAVKPLVEKLTAIEDVLIQSKAKTPYDTINLPSRLNAKLAALTSVVSSADTAPTQQAYDVFIALSTQIDLQLNQLRDIIATDVAMFNTLIREIGAPAVVPPQAESVGVMY